SMTLLLDFFYECARCMSSSRISYNKHSQALFANFFLGYRKIVKCFLLTRCLQDESNNTHQVLNAGVATGTFQDPHQNKSHPVRIHLCHANYTSPPPDISLPTFDHFHPKQCFGHPWHPLCVS